jgi:hypothetical protein
MRKCPWCGRMNLNVYAYCQGCGRGFAGPPEPEEKPRSRPARKRWYWPFGSRAA